jgi:hypothetical protein
MNILKAEFRVGDVIEIDEKEMNLIFNRVEQAVKKEDRNSS